MAAEGGGTRRGGGPVRAASLVALLVMIAGLAAAPAPAQERPPNTGARDGAPRGTGLPLPRFASLRADEVNMRAGPGVRYPVEWVYRRRGLPVEIIAEFDTWRKVRDWNGTVGWVHRSMLAGRRMAITTASEVVMRRAPDATAPAVARAEPGVIARILACDGTWCRIEARGLAGWTERRAFWGTFRNEKID